MAEDREENTNDGIYNSDCDSQDNCILDNLFQSTNVLGGTMSHDGNTRLLESLYEQFLDEGYSESEAAEKAKQAFEEME